MKEHREIALAMEETKRVGRKMAVATVVRVKGSAYRREGAKLLIDEEGNTTGVISGGCLEPDVVEVAKQVMADGRPILKSYHLDEDLVWGLGLGCPGMVDIWIEAVPDSRGPKVMHTPPSSAGEDAENPGFTGENGVSSDGRKENDSRDTGREPFAAWSMCLKEERSAVLATLLESSSPDLPIGARLFIPEEGEPSGDLGDASLNQLAVKLARKKLDTLYPRSETSTFFLSGGGKAEIFVDVNLPPFELMIFGAGHDAIPVAKLAAELGFRTTVIDPRPAYANEERFPGARIILTHADAWEERVMIGRRTFVIVMNHHLERDQAAIRFALNSPAPYVGVLGPRSRRQRMLEALEKEGVIFGEAELARMYNPVGLDIGAETSEEVAVSILSEVLAFRNGHMGGFLRGREKIHQSARK
ncbi:XdhC family protein [Lihuaxuella thermophila]|uniref:Xanthine and CO dehydrogenase maturation factor, XdhC/CoxF family n=1 Tax=Lihuaxuella thermophila TaxID=1173111 RepID=A0A1H8J5Y9_9BACL|nr:XdhC/CoxI family protein [Lihuaxuella thermophila]SEN76152.1 Xanthine and CO dehydrogenase maturation factor, XdhC/CoxF family [Lihuaxuella thermophila]